jgi:heptosyltransferase-3
MCAKSNIIDELRKKLAQMAHKGQRGVILQPGALGDCILTLPLAMLMKQTVCGGGVDIIGRTEYIGILPGRSCIDGVKSLETIGLHRLFVRENEFALADPDPLIMTFAEWTWITTFLGDSGSDFERNLIFTANCSHSAEIMTLAMKPKADSTPSTSSGQASSPRAGFSGHISEFYKVQFTEQSSITTPEDNKVTKTPFIRATQADIITGKEILAENGIIPGRKPIVIQPGSGGAHKCWHLDNFLSVAKMLKDEGADVLFLLGPAETERFEEKDMAKIVMSAPRLTCPPLADVVAVLSNAAGYLGNDSGITHLAAAMGVRTVAVFGPTDSAIYSPLGPAVTVLQSREDDFANAVSRHMQHEAATALLAAGQD